jgi:hypothetical protein
VPRRDDRIDEDWDDDRDDEETGIEIDLGFFPLAFFFFFCTPRVEINDRVRKKPWGRHFIPLEPGRHTLSVYFPYVFWSECGLNTVDFRLRRGEVKFVSYYMPPIVFLAGSLTVRSDDD